MSKNLLIYTREPMHTDIYDAKLAYSMHLAIDCGDGYKALNHNSGVFFAKVTHNPDGTMNAKSLKAPFAFKLQDGKYGVVAVRTNADGSPDEQSCGCVLAAVTSDFLHYDELGLIKLCDTYVEKVAVKFCEKGQAYKICYMTEGVHKAAKCADFYSLSCMPVNVCDNDPNCQLKKPELEGLDIEGAHSSCEIEIPDDIAEKLINKLTTPKNIAIDFPAEVTASSADELSNIKAVARYTDGSTDEKRVDWDLSAVDFSKPGRYEIKGSVHQDHFAFPVATDRADPCIGKWNGKYYFIATNDADGNRTLNIRCADSIPELVNAEEVCILDTNTYEDIRGLLWAPEFHIINDRLYIFHAATTGEFFWEESHLMVLREGGDPMNKDDWSRTKRITKKDGSELCEAGKVISLDMTTFRWEGKDYVAWSQRQFVPVDQGAWLLFARLDTNDPWKLASDPIVLSKPDYGWANNHTFVDEGPFALLTDDKVWLSFSSAAVDSTYVVSFITLEKGKDPLVAENWVKSNYPSFTSRSVEGEFGTGHNAYVIDDDGKVWNTYHARPGVYGPRSSGIRRVHFDVYGEPVLDVTEELDVNPDLKEVKTVLTVK